MKQKRFESLMAVLFVYLGWFKKSVNNGILKKWGKLLHFIFRDLFKTISYIV